MNMNCKLRWKEVAPGMHETIFPVDKAWGVIHEGESTTASVFIDNDAEPVEESFSGADSLLNAMWWVKEQVQLAGYYQTECGI